MRRDCAVRMWKPAESPRWGNRTEKGGVPKSEVKQVGAPSTAQCPFAISGVRLAILARRLYGSPSPQQTIRSSHSSRTPLLAGLLAAKYGVL